MADPYLYPGTDILINKLDIRDAKKLQDAEALIFFVKMNEPIPVGAFNYEHLKEIHRLYFADLYPWAGEERTIDFSKGDSFFARHDYINKEINKLFLKLKSENYLIGQDYAKFCNKMSFYFNEINALHPFREGNGRTLRIFCEALAENAGYHLDWTKVTAEEYLHANIKGFHGNYGEMTEIFQKITFSNF